MLAQSSNVSHRIEDLLVIQSIFERRHRTASLADEMRKRGIGFNLNCA